MHLWHPAASAAPPTSAMTRRPLPRASSRSSHPRLRPHFREEEEVLFPLVAHFEEARPLLVEALLDHQRLRALVARVATVTDVRPCIREIGELLEAHVRREGRELFPLIERHAAAELERAALPDAKGRAMTAAALRDRRARALLPPGGAFTLLAGKPGRGRRRGGVKPGLACVQKSQKRRLRLPPLSV
jgi:hypothetical protein